MLGRSEDPLLGPGQVTDVYLLALAVRHERRLVTLDTRIDSDAAAGAGPTHMDVIR